MDCPKKSGKSYLAGLLIAAAFLVQLGFLAIPRQADAVIPVTVDNPFLFTYRVNQLPTDPNWLRDWILKPAARVVVRAVLQATTQQIVSWIQGNKGKNVGYVKNLRQDLRNEANIAGGEFLNNLAGVNLCGNISAYLRLTLQLPSFQQQTACTVTDIAQNLNSFYQDFNKGGWKSFIQVSVEPQNNPYGAYLIALDSKVAIEEGAKNEVSAQFQAGQSFKGFNVPVQNCQTVNNQNLINSYSTAASYGVAAAPNTNKTNLSGLAAIVPGTGTQLPNATNPGRLPTIINNGPTPAQLSNLSIDQLYQQFLDLNNSQDAANALYQRTGDSSQVIQLEQQRRAIQDEVNLRYPNLNSAPQEVQVIEQNTSGTEAIPAFQDINSQALEAEQAQAESEANGRQQVCTTEYETQTPGQLIMGQLNKAVGSGIDFAISAKDFDEMVAAIFTALVNKVMSSSFMASTGGGGSAVSGGGLISGNLNTPGEDLSKNELVQRIEGGIFLHDKVFAALNQTLIQTRLDIFAAKQNIDTLSAQNQGTADVNIQKQIADLQQQIKDKQVTIQNVLSKQNTLLYSDQRIIGLLKAFFEAPDANTVTKLVEQLPQALALISDAATGVSNFTQPPPPTGNLRDDALTIIGGMRDNLFSYKSVLISTLGEISRQSKLSQYFNKDAQFRLQRDAISTQQVLLQNSYDQLSILSDQIFKLSSRDQTGLTGLADKATQPLLDANSRLNNTIDVINNADIIINQ